MIKKFDSFISEGNDWLNKKDIERGEYGIHHKKTNTNSEGNDWLSKKDIERGEYGTHYKKQTKNLNLRKLPPEELSAKIQSVKPGDTLLLRCHWAVSEYAVPRIFKDVFRNNFEKINCSTLTKADVDSLVFKPNKFYLIHEIHRAADDVLKPLLSAILNSDKSGFIITTTNYDNDDSEFWNVLATPSMKDRFTNVYEAI